MGVCGEDGACVDETNVIYVAPNGVDAGDCTRTAPCKGIQFSFSRASATRNHVVLSSGTYTEGDIAVDSNLASKIIIHGNGARIDSGSGIGFAVAIPAVLRDLEIISVVPNTGGLFTPGLLLVTDTVVERLKIRAINGVSVAAGTFDARELVIEVTDPGEGVGIGASSGAKLTLDRVKVSGGKSAITAASDFVNVDIKNTVVYGTSKIALDLTGAVGTLDSSTIVYAGLGVTAGPRVLKCGFGLTVRSSILWDRNSTSQTPPLQGPCPLVSVIAGKFAIPGAMALDPMFVDETNNDFHLAPNSPARDLVDTGPAYDFEGDPRPSGTRFDIGADETP